MAAMAERDLNQTAKCSEGGAIPQLPWRAGFTGFFRARRQKARIASAMLLSGIVGLVCGAFVFGSLVGADSGDALERTNLRQALHMSQIRAATLSSEASSARSQAALLQTEKARLHAELSRLRRMHQSLVASLETWSSQFAKEVERGVKATGLELEGLVDTYRRETSSHRGGPFVALPKEMGRQPEHILPPAVAKALELESIVQMLPMSPPLTGAIRVSSDFGPRADPFTHQAADHTGLDLPAPRGRPVLATAPGIVTMAGREGDYGTLVEIEHEGGLSTRYAHLDSLNVKSGTVVVGGQTIGTVGSTGRSTGPHLHYEIRMEGRILDPAKFIAAGRRLAAIRPRR